MRLSPTGFTCAMDSTCRGACTACRTTPNTPAGQEPEGGGVGSAVRPTGIPDAEAPTANSDAASAPSLSDRVVADTDLNR